MKYVKEVRAALFILIFFSIGHLSAQTYLEGQTLDSISKEALPFVNVYNKTEGKGISSDKNGKFKLEIGQDGFHQIVISCVGYQTRYLTVACKKGISISLTLLLQAVSESLEEVVVSGTMKEVSKSDSPIPVEVYSPAFFRKNPTPALFESLQNINGVRPQINCSVCNTGDIHINGMEGPYTMILIDGMPIVSGLSTVYGLNGIPNALIERLEIVKGPASTLYGSEAVGGLINVITKSSLSAPKIYADVLASSWQEINTDIGLKFRAGKHHSLLGINYFNYEKPIDKNGDGFTDLTQQDRISVFNKWNFFRKDQKEFSIAARYVYEDRWGGQSNWNTSFRGGDSIYGESIYTSRIELLGNYQLPFKKENAALNFSFSDHQQHSVYGTTTFIARQLIGFAQIRWIKTIKKHNLVSGITNRITHYDDNTPATANTDSLTKNQPSLVNLPGVFIQDEYKINDQNMVLTGIRYDYHPVHGNIFSPRLNYKWSPGKKNILRAGFGNGFRVVNIFTEDHAALTGSRKVIITEDLHPERSWNLHLNWVHSIYRERFFANIDVSLFNSSFSNKIVADYLSNDEQIIYSNARGTTVSRGIGINTEWNWAGKIKLNIGATLMDVFRIDGDKKVNQLLTEKFSGTFTLSYIISKWGLSLDYTGNVIGPMELPLLEHDFRSPKSPWYSIQNIQVSKNFRKYWTLYGGVKNLLNFTPAAYSIMRSFDPFDKKAGDSETNPFGYTFDTGYVYSSFQGIRAFLGLRYTLR